MSKKNKTIAAVLAVGVAAVAILVCAVVFRPSYTVSFYNDIGEVIKYETDIPRGASAEAPNLPRVSYGKVFSHWDTDFTVVKGNLEIHPVCEELSGKGNVFALPGAYGVKDGMVNIPLQLCGNVCLSGFDIAVEYDSECLVFESVYNEDGGIVYNSEEPGIIRINYVSPENTVGDVDICGLKFKVIANESTETPVNITVKKVCANDGEKIVDTDYTVINSTVYIAY